MTVIEIDNRWFVAQDRVIGPFKTHADAWAWIDHREGEPISRPDTISQQIWDDNWD